MMLKTSSRKINPFWNMVGFSLRKNLGIIVVLIIVALLYCPGSFLINFKDFEVTYQSGHNINFLLQNFATIVTVVASVAAIFFNVINFSFLYKKSSSDVFHALPLTRSELLLSRLFSGLISTLIPILVCYISFGFMLAFNSWMGSFTQLAYYLLHTLIIILVCSTFSLIFIISAGSMFDLGISLIGANLALLAVGWIFDSILTETLVGYNGYSTSDIMYNLSPPYFCAVGLSSADRVKQYGISGQSIEFFIRSVIYIAIFVAVSIMLYNRRKAEKGGTAYAYKFMYLGCSLLTGICGGFLLGMIFNSNITSLAFWFFAISGSVLTSVVYGTVTNRGFKGAWRSVIMGGFSALILIAVAVSGITGGFGYTQRIPEKSRIKNVSVSVFDENITFYDPQQVIELHKAILNTNATDYDYSVPYHQRQTIDFYYQLDNGKVISREFTVEESKVAQKLLDIYQSNERLNMIKEHIDVANSNQFNLYFYAENNYISVNITKSEVNQFLEVYWQDVQNSNTSIFGHEGYEFIELSGYKILDNNRDSYFSFQFELHNGFTNTKQFIAEHNLIERSKSQEETYVKY